MAFTVSYSLLYCAIVDDDEGITQYVYYTDGTTIKRLNNGTISLLSRY